MNELIAALAAGARPAPDLVLPVAAVFTRVSLLVFVLPGLGARGVPVRVRLFAALAVTAALAPAVAPDTEGLHPVPLLAGEAMVGAYLGLSFRLLLFVLSVSGTVIAQALSLSQVFGAAVAEEADTSVSTLLVLAGATLFLTMGLHVEAFGVLVRSYETLPAGNLAGAPAILAERLLRGFADGLALGLSLALPFVLMNLAYNALLGLLNKAMPQLMVTFVGMPAITFAGLCLLAASVTLILTVWADRGLAITGGLLP